MAKKTYMYIMRRNLKGKMDLIAIQDPPRKLRTSKITYWYNHNGDIYYSHNKNATYFIPAGFDNNTMQLYRDVFIKPPLTVSEQEWLDRNGIEIITSNDGEV